MTLRLRVNYLRLSVNETLGLALLAADMVSPIC
jgi:hypothetical protein